jgi:hypothetical protein
VRNVGNITVTLLASKPTCDQSNHNPSDVAGRLYLTRVAEAR